MMDAVLLEQINRLMFVPAEFQGFSYSCLLGNHRLRGQQHEKCISH